jgi:hypothetical protein
VTERSHTVDALFASADPTVRLIYDRLLTAVETIGPFTAEPRQRSVHRVHSVAFAGVHPRKNSVILSLRLDGPVESPRVHRTEHVSAARWHVEFKLTDPAEVDDELHTWLAAAMDLV